MYLERVDIVGFRGINRLSLTLTQPAQRGASITGSAHQGQAESFLTNTVLIGENAWEIQPARCVNSAAFPRI